MRNFIEKKIVYFFPSNNRENEWQYYHFVQELESLGIEFDLFNPKQYGDRFDYELLKKLKAEKNEISLFMTASYDGEISVETILEIKKIGLPTLLICYDNLSIPFVHKRTAKYYDLVWLTSNETESLFRRWNAKTIFLPYAANPNIFKPQNRVVQNKTVGFIGSCYGNRPRLLNLLAANQIQTEVYTNSQDNIRVNKPPIIKQLNNLRHSTYYFINLLQFTIGRKCIKGSFLKNFQNERSSTLANNEYLSLNPRVSFNEMVELYSGFAITLNISDLLDTYVLRTPISKIHLRTFEVPMSGGLQIIRRNNEIQQYYEENKEILLYDSDEELIDKCKFYLNNEEKVLEMKHLAHMRSINEHSWSKRFSKIHEAIF